MPTMAPPNNCVLSLVSVAARIMPTESGG